MKSYLDEETGIVFHPSVFAINVRVFLKELSYLYGGVSQSSHQCPNSSSWCLTLEDIPDHYIDWISQAGFQYVYLLGNQQGKEVAVKFMHSHYKDVPDHEICSSPFAIKNYIIHEDFGGIDAYNRLRHRLLRRHLGILLDFVPNHIALDHDWVDDRTCEYVMKGTPDLLNSFPQNLYKNKNGELVFHGKDTSSDGWKDTAQLNYFNSNLRTEMIQIAINMTNLCDGIRCDMAMLLISEIFENNWTESYKKWKGVALVPKIPEFWPQLIKVLMQNPNFLFIGEVSWGLEDKLIEYGFDYCFDKTFYDLIKQPKGCSTLKEWIMNKSFACHRQSCRYLENYNEKRAAFIFSDIAYHQAAAFLTYLLPGMKLFHFGQFEGRKIHIPMQRCRLASENSDEEDNRIRIADMYIRLMDVMNRMPILRTGEFLWTPVLPPSNFHTSHHENIVAFCVYQKYRHLSEVAFDHKMHSEGDDGIPNHIDTDDDDNETDIPLASSIPSDSQSIVGVLDRSASEMPTKLNDSVFIDHLPPSIHHLAKMNQQYTALETPQSSAIRRDMNTRIKKYKISYIKKWLSASYRWTSCLILINFSNQGSKGRIKLPTTIINTLTFWTSLHPTSKMNSEIVLRELFDGKELIKKSLKDFKEDGVDFSLNPWKCSIYEILLFDHFRRY